MGTGIRKINQSSREDRWKLADFVDGFVDLFLFCLFKRCTRDMQIGISLDQP